VPATFQHPTAFTARYKMLSPVRMSVCHAVESVKNG